MFNRPKNDDDLNDSLADLIGGVDADKAANPIQPPANYVPCAGRPNKFKDPQLYTETCRKCGGSGTYRGPSSYGRRCFECDGAGHKTFKTSPEHRAKAKTASANRKAKRAQEIADAVAAKRTQFVEQHRDIVKWLHVKADAGSNFATSLLGGLDRFGSLTVGQIAAVERFQQQDAERATDAAKRLEAAPTVDTSKIHAAFDKAFARAQEKGLRLRYPTITVGAVTISPAGPNSKNPGALYVKNAGQYVGKIAQGRFLGTRECTSAIEAKVVEFIADPKAAAKAYGQETGTCCICNATLTSKWRFEGIGPVCATKFGW